MCSSVRDAGKIGNWWAAGISAAAKTYCAFLDQLLFSGYVEICIACAMQMKITVMRYVDGMAGIRGRSFLAFSSIITPLQVGACRFKLIGSIIIATKIQASG